MAYKALALSVIIPTLNEEKFILTLVSYLKLQLQNVHHEIIVSDAGSNDRTIELAKKAGVIVINCNKMSRAFQMNEGASIAVGEILYFIHADTVPPDGFYKDIMSYVKAGAELGCFRFKFDSTRWLLALNAYFTRFNFLMFRGGDQSLFITQQAFEKLEGFCNKYRIMEEYEFIKRAQKSHCFKIIPRDVLVSARKYEENSYFRVNFANFVVFTLFRLGASQTKMIYAYKKLLKHPKAKSLQ